MPARNPFHILAKPAGPLCNLDCSYCFYLEKEKYYPAGKTLTMPDHVLERFIRDTIAAYPLQQVHFAWQGGEPTLCGLPFFEKALRLQRQYANGKIISNSIQTNGILLDDHWAAFLAENRFLVGLSLDGPEELHDRYRVDKGGRPSFRRVMSALEILQRFRVEYNILTVASDANSRHPMDVYRFLKDTGSQYLQFIPLVERRAADAISLAAPGEPGYVTGWSVKPEEYGNFLVAIFDQWVRYDVGRTFVQIFDEALQIWFTGQPGLCVFRETCGDALAVEHNGDLYSCDHYVYPEYHLGNIGDMPLQKLVTHPRQRQFGQDKKDTLPAYCHQCDVRFACNGECPKHRFTTTPDGEPGLNYFCAAYKKFFHHIDPYMKYMCEQLRNHQPPANVMPWARKQPARG